MSDDQGGRRGLGGERQSVAERAREEARRFLTEEREFRLGALPTEQPHTLTRRLAETTAADTARGVALLLAVDHDLPPRAQAVLEGPELARLVAALAETQWSGGRVVFSGCGATGRLAIILEKMWRLYWDEAAALDPRRSGWWRAIGESALSIMTGGDRALIRSVESFEDFASFGRRQVADAGLGRRDLLVAISEGGETPSVIGTAWEALDRGAEVFFVFNNPTDLLRRTVKRSRELIENDRVTKLDLTTGPMALAGSTRLEATTIEMLVLGAALEIACDRVRFDPRRGGSAEEERRVAPLAPPAYAQAFERLVRDLESREALCGIAAMVDLESDIYRAGGLVTYLSDDYLLDVLSDTTERTPTFMLPPFRPAGDTRSPVSWAYAKDPLRPSDEAWRSLLGRLPRGITWSAEDYRAMGALPRMIAAPPVLDLEEILSYRIGRERDPSRFTAPESALILVGVGSPPAREAFRYLEENAADYGRTVELAIAAPSAASESGRGKGGSRFGSRRISAGGWEPARIGVPVALAPSPMRLFSHLAAKLVFNTLSTAAMAKLGRIRGNWMIQLDATNKKLVDRATRIIADLAGMSYAAACEELHLTLLQRAEALQRPADSAVVETLRRLGIS